MREVGLLEDAVVEARGLSVRYGSTLALDDVSLSVGRGRVLAVVGSNGAGKSSLFRALLGLLPVASGEPRIFGRAPQALTPADRGRIAYVSERHAELGHATLADLVEVREALYARFDRALFDDLMRDLKVPSDRTIDTLSRGQRAGVAVGLALSQQPELLLLDDPTLGLDPLARRQIVQGLLRVASGGDVTVLFATHELADVERIADEVLLLRRGRGAVAVDTDAFVAEAAAYWVPTDVPREALDAIDGVVWVWPQRRGQHVVLHGDAERLERAGSAVRALCERADLEVHAVSFEELALAWLAADRELS